MRESERPWDPRLSLAPAMLPQLPPAGSGWCAHAWVTCRMEPWVQAPQPFDFPRVRSSWSAGWGYRSPGPFSNSVSRILEGNSGDLPTAAAVILEAETSSLTGGRACGKPHCPLRTDLRRPAVGQPDWPRLAKVIWACLGGWFMDERHM